MVKLYKSIVSACFLIMSIPVFSQALIDDSNSSGIIINEIMASNIDVYRDPSTNFGSWVELYNPSTKDINLGGLYVSDNSNDLRKHKLVNSYGILRAKGYALLNFDHHEVWTSESYRQIDDKLDCDGGTIIVSDGENILAQQDYPKALGRISFARTFDGGSEWGLCGIPTPGASNSNGVFATEQISAPVVNKASGLFSGTIYLEVSIPEGATLKYTTNGTTPTLTNGSVSTTGQFSIKQNSCYRFRLFKEGYLPSNVVTRTFISSNNEPFPIISIVTDKNNLDGSTDYGLFKEGKYGRPGNGKTTKCNWNMDWDRPVHFDYITTDNECVVSQECDFSMCGGWSRSWTPHSFKLKATKMYDFQNTFKYQFFDDKPFLNNKTLQIRNGGNDTNARIKDAAVQQIAARSGIYVDYQSWQPVHVYINAQPYAVLNMREPNNKHYAYSHYGIDTDDMEQFEISPDSGYVQMEGTGEYFKKLYDLSYDAENESTYSDICKLLDVDEFVNYMAIQLYAGGNDWPQNNVKGFVDTNDGKFHFVLFDLDFALSTNEPLNTFKNKQYYTFDQLHGYDYSRNVSIEGTRKYNKENEFVTLFLNLLNNDNFKKKFIDTFCLVGGSVYTPARVSEIVNGMATYLSSGNYVNPWNTANSIINGFANRRSTMISHIQKFFSLSNDKKQNVTLTSNVEGAKIMVNDIEVPTGEFDGTLFGPVVYKAVAPAGYDFVGWTGGSMDGETTMLINRGATWKYAVGSIPADNWKTVASAFSSSGAAPLGYGKSIVKTSLTGNKLAYYFGRTFTINNTPSSDEKFILNYTIDDGFIIYINGVEAARYNMPSGTVTSNTAASTYCNNNPDEGTVVLKSSLFKRGSNFIAVEVHNNSTSSSDILWDAELLRVLPREIEDSDILSEDAEYEIAGSGTYNLVACFEPIDEDELVAKGTTPIKINEVSAANTMAVNDNFKKKDWIELYNTTEEAIDIAGMYISDKEDNPEKYQIPSGVVNTVIEPHGHIILWADEAEGVSQLHVPFKLGNNEGEKVILMSEDGSWKDVLTYTSHLGTQSVGLYPDGSNNVYVMDAPTIGIQNKLDSYASFYMLYVPSFDEPVEPNAIAEIASDVIERKYYSVNGICMGNTRTNLSAGVYILRCTHEDGTISSKKIHVR